MGCCKVFEKFIWLTVLLLTVAVAVYEILIWVSYYYSSLMMSPVSTNGITYPYDQMPLPRVTFCSRSMTNSTFYGITDATLRNYTLSLGLPSHNPDVTAAADSVKYWSLGTMNDAQSRYQGYVNSIPTTAVGAYLSLGYQCGGIMSSCRLGNRSVACCENSALASSYYGSCVVLKGSHYQTIPGLTDNYEMKIQLDQVNYQKFNNGIPGNYHPGFWMFVDTVGYHMGDPIFVPLGKDVFVSVKSKQVLTMNPPWTHLPFFDSRCSTPLRDYRRKYNSDGSFDEINSEAALRQYEADRDAQDSCMRTCLATKISAICGCTLVSLLSPEVQLSSLRYCSVNDTQLCAQPLLNNSQLTPVGSTYMTLWAYCSLQGQCPPPCFQRRIVPTNVMVNDLNINFFHDRPDLIPLSAVVHIYYSSLDYVDPTVSDLDFYSFLRQVGLTLCMWLAVGCILIIILLLIRLICCCPCCCNAKTKSDSFKGNKKNNARVAPNAAINGHQNQEMQQINIAANQNGAAIDAQQPA